MIKSIETVVIWDGRNQGTTWFHPRPCMQPGAGNGPDRCFMTFQSITGSDVFGPVHCSASSDQGVTWSEPRPIPGLGRRDLPGGLQEGVCDVVPGYHPQTGTTLALGHTVFYKDNVLTQPSEDRCPVYAVRTRDGRWGPRTRMAWSADNVPAVYTCGCAQRVTLPDGRLLIPLSIAREPDQPRSACSALCTFDGTTLGMTKVGNRLSLPVRRGLLEPSLVRFGERYYMTFRAEDKHGYVSTSDDGLTWEDIQPWCWDDGEPLAMSTTQQHWIDHSSGLFLVYTRKAKANAKVMRWRAPLYICQVEPDTLRLIRSTEKVVFPMVGDGIHNPDQVPRMGNFHTLNASQETSWVTVGETLPSDAWRGNTLLARITWAERNTLYMQGHGH